MIDHPQDRMLLEALDESQPATVPELAAVLDEHPATVERRCITLQRDGYVRQCTGGKYTLAPDLCPEIGPAEPTAAD